MTQEPSNQDAEAATSSSTPPDAWSREASAPPAPAAEASGGPPEASPTASEPAETTAVAEPAAPVATAEPPEEPPAQRPVTRRKELPPWLPFFLVAIIPAAIVGVIVYVLASGGGGSGGNAAGIVDGLIRLGSEDQSTVSSYSGELPPDFSNEFPIYNGADVVVSIASPSDQGTNYFIVMNTSDALSKVFDFYNGTLDKDPWQVEVGRSSDSFTGLRFSRPDNPDITGDVTLHQSDLDSKTEIYLSYTDVSQAVLPGGTTTPFSLSPSRPLPAGFPTDIPIFNDGQPSTVVDTYFERGQGGQAFVVTFLTHGSADDVIQFYRDEFQKRGWNVNDSSVSSSSFALGIEFDDGNAQSISGSINADSFEKDNSLTKVDMLLQVSPTRGRGN